MEAKSSIAIFRENPSQFPLIRRQKKNPTKPVGQRHCRPNLIIGKYFPL